MTLTKDLQKAGKFELQAYRRSADHRRIAETHIAYSGSPFKHPHQSDKVILVADPFSQNTYYYEFNREDIALAEDLPNIVNLENESLTMVRLWVKKGALAVRCTPFRVADTRG
jgi:inorganic pyrophosphatase